MFQCVASNTAGQATAYTWLKVKSKSSSRLTVESLRLNRWNGALALTCSCRLGFWFSLSSSLSRYPSNPLFLTNGGVPVY